MKPYRESREAIALRLAALREELDAVVVELAARRRSRDRRHYAALAALARRKRALLAELARHDGVPERIQRARSWPLVAAAAAITALGLAAAELREHTPAEPSPAHPRSELDPSCVDGADALPRP